MRRLKALLQVTHLFSNALTPYPLSHSPQSTPAMNKLRSLLITEGMLSYCEYATRGDYSDAFIVLINVLIKVLLTTKVHMILYRIIMGYAHVTLSLNYSTTKIAILCDNYVGHLLMMVAPQGRGNRQALLCGYSITCRFCCRHTGHQAERWCRFECTWTVLD